MPAFLASGEWCCRTVAAEKCWGVPRLEKMLGRGGNDECTVAGHVLLLFSCPGRGLRTIGNNHRLGSEARIINRKVVST